MAQARHGLAAIPQGRAVLGDLISLKTSPRFVNVFSELIRSLEGRKPGFGDLQVRHLLSQILLGHRLWTYASGKNERFVALADIDCWFNHAKHDVWMRLRLDRGEAQAVSKSATKLITEARLPGRWVPVTPQRQGGSVTILEQDKPLHYAHRPIDRIPELFQALRPALWCAVTSAYPYRKYYLLADQTLGRKRLPQWAAIYVFFFYLSDLTRYRPLHFARFLESKYGPQVESIIDECPRQFLFLMASELLQREVAPAALA